MTEREILDATIRREGGFVNDPADKGGPTKYGITAKTLGAWRRLGRDATAAEVEALELHEAHAIYRDWYVETPGFVPAKVPSEALRVLLIDFGINSGPERAVRWLQRVLGLTPTGRLDFGTRAALADAYTGRRIGDRPALDVVADALVAARLYMVDRTTDAPSQKRFEEGLENRALEFFGARP